MLVSDLRVDHRRTYLARLDSVDPADFGNAYREMIGEAQREVADQGAASDSVVTSSFAEMRYVGQSWKLSVFIDDGIPSVESIAALRRDFDSSHQQAYGFAVPDEPVEVVSIGVTVTGHISSPNFARVPTGGAESPRSSRDVWFSRETGVVQAGVYDRYGLSAGATVPGPAVVEERESTTLIPAGYVGIIDEIGVMTITTPSSAALRREAHARPE